MGVEFVLNSFSWSHLNKTIWLCLVFCALPFKSSEPRSCSPDFIPLSKCLGELTAAMPSSKVLLLGRKKKKKKRKKKFCWFLEVMGEGRSINLFK